MIPWRLTFVGIRDYAPAKLDLSGNNVHVMITGPNGAGKSTITFCMGAVLYSSKVDIEGLKSRNLPTDKTWKTRIAFLFKNEGKMKIDAPLFIEFGLNIVQEPGQPIKKEFTISSGDVMDEWEHTTKYSSGDRVYNFSAYRQALQYKYKIDPDLYYLIWYQQEVNQFAIMNPEERFRIFSEMHGIDKTQRDWEESIEQLKDSEEGLKYAETNVKIKKQELSLKKQELDRYNDNQRRLHDGAKKYISALLKLESYFKQEIQQDKRKLEQLKADQEEAKQTILEIDENKRSNIEEKSELENQKNKLNIDIQQLENEKVTLQNKTKKLNEDILLLEEELKGTETKRHMLTRTEEEIQIALVNLEKDKKKTTQNLQENMLISEEKKVELNKVMNSKAKLSHQIAENEKKKKKYQELLKQYKSSFEVQQQIDKLEESIVSDKNKRHDLSIKLSDLKDELHILKENRVLSLRQIESLKFLKNKNIKAYPLRELIQLDSTARLNDESRFNSIKYTIFFEGKDILPPNDLYHVPLIKIVPERLITKLPSLHVEIKENLSNEMMPIAVKALWWVDQFFSDTAVQIKNESLYDGVGIRGRQEKEGYILTERALMARKEKVVSLITKINEKQLTLDRYISTNTKRVQDLNGIIQSVKEAEAFMTMEYERVQLKRKLEKSEIKEIQLQKELEELDEKRKGLDRIQVEQESLENDLQREAAIYNELGQMKEKFQQLTNFKKLYDEEIKKINKMKTQLEILDDQFDQVSREIKEIDRKIQEKQDEYDNKSHNLIGIRNKIGETSDSFSSHQLKLIDNTKELTDLQTVHEKLYNKFISDLQIEPINSIQHLLNEREDGSVKFNHAASENVDPAAPDNYEAVKSEFDRLENEYKRTKILLEQDLERTEQLKDHLEKTVNMRVLEIQQRFRSYMAQFQFEAEVSWEPFEDKRKRTLFRLYIKARKEGHRGVMEDVSVKARGGKVGKGVSGGEESLSSLLFALALLQNLQTAPGFIVLDEFDSALDENRKSKVFDLYVHELQRKLIILTPKSHEDTYLNRFSKAFVVQHDPTIPKSKVVGLVKT